MSATRREHVWAGILILAGLCVTYRDVVFRGRTFLTLNYSCGTVPHGTQLPEQNSRVAWGYPGPAPGPGRSAIIDGGALAWIIEPYEFFSRERFRHGEIPLWNPHSGGGESHLGSGESSVFDPFQLPIYLAPRSWFPHAYDFGVLLRFFVMGFFTYLFVRRLGIPFWAAVLAGVVASQTSYSICYGQHAPMKVAAMMPIVFYAFGRLLERVRPLTIAGAGVAVALLTLADFAQMTLCVFAFAVAYYAVAAAVRVAAASERRRESLRLAGGLLAAVVIGLALSAPMILPFVENIAPCHSQHDSADPGDCGPFLSPAQRIVTLLPYRGFLGQVPVNYYSSLFVLAIAAPLAAWPCRRRRTTLWFFLAGAALCYLIVLNLPGMQFQRHIPILRQVCLLKYLPPLVEFSLAVLAALAAAHLPRQRSTSRILLAATLLFGALLAWLLRGADLPASSQILVQHLVRVGRVLAGLGLVVIAWETFALKPRYLAMGLIAVFLVEVALLNRGVCRPWRYDPYVEPPFVAFLRQQPGPFRIFSGRDAIHPNLSSTQGIDDIRYVAGLNPRRRHAYYGLFVNPLDLYFFGTSERTDFNRFFNLLNATYVITVDAPPDAAAQPSSSRPIWSTGPPSPGAQTAPEQQFELVYDREVRIYRNRWAFPRAFVVYQAEQAQTMEQAAERMRRDDFRPCQRAVLEGEPAPSWAQSLWQSGPAPPGCPADVVQHSPNLVRIKARADRPGILVLTDTFGPGWRATVDGQPSSIHAANVMFRGVYLEPGEHEITFVYWPASFRNGLILAGAALLVLAALVAWECRRFVRVGK